MSIIDKELATKIAKKLGADLEDRKRHIWATVKHNGILIAQFGIRKGSDKNLGHDYVPGQIHVRPQQARLLGQCPMSREQWVEELTKKGFIL